MDIGAVLTRAWNITWKYKVLWLLGILAGCSASGRGNPGQATSGFRGYQFAPGDLQAPLADEFGRLFERVPEGIWIAVALAILCLVLLISLLFLVLGVFGQAGLIAGFGRADEGYDISLGEAFSLGGRHFWRLLGIRITVWLVGAIVGVVVAVSVVLFVLGTFGIGLLFLIPLLCLLIPLAIAIDAYIVLTMVAAIEEGVGVFEAFGRAWTVVREHLGSVLVMTLILTVGGGIVGTALFLPFIGIVVPAIVGGLTGDETALISGLAISGLCLLAAVPILILLSGVLTTYVTGAWTLTYRRLTGKVGAKELGTA